MKKTLLFLLLAITFISKAQNVLTKDSTVSLANGITSTVVSTYTYNTDCRVFSKKSPSNQWFYTYYANGSLFQETLQLFDIPSNTYKNSSITTYLYTNSGKIASTTTQDWSPIVNSYINQSKDSIVYGGNNFTIENLQYTWDIPTSAWVLDSKTDYFNNAAGLVDSTITTQFTSEKIIIKSYNTYDASSKLSMNLTDQYDSTNTLRLTSHSSYFYDSSNFLRTDSIYNEFKTPSDASFIPNSSISIKQLYNTDGTLKETDVTTILILFGGNTATSKTYYFYGPCSSVLPVTLFSFSGEQNNNNAILHWKTANEINSSYFSIQRSTDAVNFTNIGKVKAAGNSRVLKDYTYTDASISLLNTQKLYYRLATTSNDGSIAYSAIVPLRIMPGRLSVFVSPNPFTNSIVLNVPMELQNVKITINDISGKTLYTTAQHTLTGKLSIDASKFAKGTYLVTIQSDGNKQVFKILK